MRLYKVKKKVWSELEFGVPKVEEDEFWNIDLNSRHSTLGTFYLLPR